jgi:hypothetical protein
MNKDLLMNLTQKELKANMNRLEIANQQLMELLRTLEEEQQELYYTKEMMVKTLAEIAPKEENVMERVLSKARNMLNGFWKKDTASEDKDEWNKIMKELE